MHLDINNGNFCVGDFNASSSFSVDMLNRLSGKYDIRKGVENAGYLNMHIRDIEHGEYAMSILFYNCVIRLLSISMGVRYNFPPFVNTDEELNMLKDRIQSINGENIYDWGKVELSQDQKGGNLSIIISYI